MWREWGERVRTYATQLQASGTYQVTYDLGSVSGRTVETNDGLVSVSYGGTVEEVKGCIRTQEAVKDLSTAIRRARKVYERLLKRT